MRLKPGAVLRWCIGIVLIMSIWPPLSLRVVNPFVLLPAFVGLILLLLPQLLRLLRRIAGKHAHAALRAVTAVLIVLGVFFAAELAVLLAHSVSPAPPDEPAVILLGAQAINGTPTIDLLGRIEAAAAYLRVHPDAVCIATGGRGPNESVSEARSSRDWLVKHDGIAASRIYMDETSTSTEENFRNAHAILRAHGLPDRAAVCTDGFHMFRATLIARRQGIKASSCPAVTDWRLAPYLYIRELFALPKTLLFDH